MIQRSWFIAVTTLLLCMPAAFAAVPDDGFGDAALKLTSDHFNVYLKSGVDASALLAGLNISDTDQQLAGQTIDASSPQRQLTSMLDVLLVRAGDVLDMHLYSYKGSIKVFANQKDLQDFFFNKFHAQLPCTGVSFYLYDFNTIYISAENFRREVLGHEMGHAIMSNYFVVQPSVKIQEVLAGYVEYQLRKSK